MSSRRSSRDKGKRRLDENYDFLLFDSNQHALKFSSIESRHVHKGKYVDLDELSDLEPIQWFTNLDILSILQMSKPIYHRLVRLFYNNLHIDEDERVSTYLLGYHISITDRFICYMIGISIKDKGRYFRGLWDDEIIETTYVDALGIIFGNPNLTILPKSCKHLLPLSTKILHHILISIILPKQYHHDEVSQMELGTMYWIMKGHNNCFGYLI